MTARVAVTGMGIVSSIGEGVDEFAMSLADGKSGIGSIASDGARSPLSIGAELRGFSFDQSVRRLSSYPNEFIERATRCANRAPSIVQTAIVAAMQAWRAAALDERACAGDHIGIVVAGSNLADKYQYDWIDRFRSNPEYLLPSFALQFMDTNVVGVLSELFAIHGEGFTVGGASASGGVALVKASQMIAQGIADVCVVVGVHADLSPMAVQGFINIGAMGGKSFKDNPAKACRPFDRAHEGFIYGQATGCIVLESLASAERRGVKPVAEIVGATMALDGNRLSNPNIDGEARVMAGALAQARLKPEDVAYLNTHGSSSPLGDQTEIQAIKRVFAQNLSTLWLNSTKALTGHCLFSAGVIETIATVIQMNKGFVHPNINLDDPIDTGCRFSGAAADDADIEVAMSNSFGFGGINTSIVMKQIGA